MCWVRFRANPALPDMDVIEIMDAADAVIEAGSAAGAAVAKGRTEIAFSKLSFGSAYTALSRVYYPKAMTAQTRLRIGADGKMELVTTGDRDPKNPALVALPLSWFGANAPPAIVPAAVAFTEALRHAVVAAARRRALLESLGAEGVSGGAAAGAAASSSGGGGTAVSTTTASAAGTAAATA